jgi:hypothetical protein
MDTQPEANTPEPQAEKACCPLRKAPRLLGQAVRRHPWMIVTGLPLSWACGAFVCTYFGWLLAAGLVFLACRED